MDDILSAVDAHTAQSIATTCLTGEILKGRTVILVTHHVKLCLPAAQYVVALANGMVEQACPASELDFSTEEAPTPTQESEPVAEAKRDEVPTLSSTGTGRDIVRKLHEDEHRAKGRVAISHYRLLLRAAGGFGYWSVFAIVFLSARGCYIWSSYVLEAWSSDENPDHLDRYLLMYSLTVIAGVILGALRWVWLYGFGNIGFVSAGIRKIHAMLVTNLAGATLGFFERTPTGRLINIFGQDMSSVDTEVSDDVGSEFKTSFALTNRKCDAE